MNKKSQEKKQFNEGDFMIGAMNVIIIVFILAAYLTFELGG